MTGIFDLRDVKGLQAGTGNTQINQFQVELERKRLRRPNMAPLRVGPVTPRPQLINELLAALTVPGPGSLGVTRLEGPPGFGKTTLAAEVCRHPTIIERFPGGVLWVTVGGSTVGGAALAGLVGWLCGQLSGEPATTVNPSSAGALLDERDPTLLVIDDVWWPHQLDPFLIGGSSCRRLITTRISSVVGPKGGLPVVVDQMSPEQAAQTLAYGIPEIPAATGRCTCALRVAGTLHSAAWNRDGTLLGAAGERGLYLLAYRR